MLWSRGRRRGRGRGSWREKEKKKKRKRKGNGKENLMRSSMIPDDTNIHMMRCVKK